MSSEENITPDQMCPATVTVRPYTAIPAQRVWTGLHGDPFAARPATKRKPPSASSRRLPQPLQDEIAPETAENILTSGSEQEGLDQLPAMPEADGDVDVDARAGSSEDDVPELPTPSAPPSRGAPGSSTDPPAGSRSEPAAADAPGSRQARSARIRTGTASTLHLPVGELRFYPRTSEVHAFCRNPRHAPDCRKSRTTKGGRKRGQGRCLGYLVAWLHDHENHASRFAHTQAIITRAMREDGRRRLKEAEGWAAFAECERALAPSEPEEPVDFD